MFYNGPRLSCCLVLLSIAVALAGVLPIQGQELILNGDFETDPGVPNGTVTDWVVSGTGRYSMPRLKGQPAAATRQHLTLATIPKALFCPKLSQPRSVTATH